ncbi:MAG: MmcQ/YjbR family DNA-binding protein [Bacteroidales bacterium]|nr:MmcQ/YjbR family DNA-binding protein [Bacteroidales bacterium]
MNVEVIREYCLSLPHVTEDMAFGDDHLLFRVFDKIFACLSLDGDDYLALKSDPDNAIDLRERYADITVAPHWNKKYWNQLCLHGSLSDELIKRLVRHSYAESSRNSLLMSEDQILRLPPYKLW